MASGISFLEILVSKVTMAIGALTFLFCGALLIFKRKSLNGSQKGLAITVLIITGIYYLACNYVGTTDASTYAAIVYRAVGQKE